MTSPGSTKGSLRATMLAGDFYPEQVGGQGIYGFELASELVKLGVRVRVVCPYTSGRAAHAYGDGLELRLLPPETKNPLVYSAFALRERARLLADTDVLHVNELFGFPLAARLPAEQHGLVVASHNAYLDRFHAARGFVKKLKYPPLIGLESVTYRAADRVLIGSEIERQPLRTLGVPDERIAVVPYGVTARRFEDPGGAVRSEVRRELGIVPEARVVLFVGRFVERKKPHVVARALRALRAEQPDIVGILVGDGELMPEVRAQAGGDAGIHLVGAVSFEALPRYYAAADAFTLPSVGEGSISLVVLEAAAAGLPLVLTADSAGQSPVFERGVNGELVPLDDAERLRAALVSALAHAERYGARSRALVREHFSWEAAARSTLREYERALARRRTRR
jgi:glycosyltransferase involved in cell wall biosynthesis